MMADESVEYQHGNDSRSVMVALHVFWGISVCQSEASEYN